MVFTSGWGDGVYPSYWALDTSGIPVATVTDFLCIEGGDGRDEREIADQAYRDNLPAAEAEALARLVAAVERDDTEALQDLLKDAPQRANQIEPGCGGAAVYEAITHGPPAGIAGAATGGELPAMPERLHMSKVTGYLDYARFLKKPRSAELMAVLEAPVVAAEPPPAAARRRSFWDRLFGRN